MPGVNDKVAGEVCPLVPRFQRRLGEGEQWVKREERSSIDNAIPGANSLPHVAACGGQRDSWCQQLATRCRLRRQRVASCWHQESRCPILQNAVQTATNGRR